jgi:hypothetical protein
MAAASAASPFTLRTLEEVRADAERVGGSIVARAMMTQAPRAPYPGALAVLIARGVLVPCAVDSACAHMCRAGIAACDHALRDHADMLNGRVAVSAGYADAEAALEALRSYSKRGGEGWTESSRDPSSGARAYSCGAVGTLAADARVAAYAARAGGTVDADATPAERGDDTGTAARAVGESRGLGHGMVPALGVGYCAARARVWRVTDGNWGWEVISIHSHALVSKKTIDGDALAERARAFHVQTYGRVASTCLLEDLLREGYVIEPAAVAGSITYPY